jgi:hypothetical protein
MSELWDTLITGLIVSLVFIALSYFFWKRYDEPTPLMIERREEKERLKAERKTWKEVEATMQAEQIAAEEKAAYERQKAAQRASMIAPEQEAVREAWKSLGVNEAPQAIQAAPSFAQDTTDKNEAHRIQEGIGLTEADLHVDDLLAVDELVQVRQDQGVQASAEAPDWGLIDKLNEIAEKDVIELPEVPQAPDLPDLPDEATIEHALPPADSEVEAEPPATELAEPSPSSPPLDDGIVRWNTPLPDDHWGETSWEEE